MISVAFIVLIVNVATNDRSRLRVEHPIITYLGTLSYGLYMYHFPLQYLIVFLLHRAGFPEGDGYNVILYAGTLLGSFGLAALSYRYYERLFLHLKGRFAVVSSRASQPATP